MKRNWTAEDVAFLKANYATKGAKYCADILGRTADAVGRKASYLSIERIQDMAGANPIWTAEDEAFLTANYIAKGAKYCAEALKKPYGGIRHKAQRLGLKRKGAGRADREVNVSGYRAVSSYNKRVRIHRAVMEKKLGRKLESWEIVHHIDEDKTNNDPSNLELLTRSEHMKRHSRKHNNKGQFTSL